MASGTLKFDELSTFRLLGLRRDLCNFSVLLYQLLTSEEQLEQQPQRIREALVCYTSRPRWAPAVLSASALHGILCGYTNC
jgi:hypothetical protein